MVDQIIDKRTVAIPGPIGTVTPQVQALHDETASARDTAESYRDQAETFAAQSHDKLDEAMTALLSEPTSDSETFQALAGLFQSTIIASSDQTGVADRTKIQAALDSGMRTIILQAPGEFYLDEPLTVQSYTTILAYGARIHYLGVGAMVRNRAATPTRSVDSVTTTAGSTSFTASGFTSSDVGSRVAIWGAGCNGTAWYGQVTAVSGSTVTLDKPAYAGSSGLTAQVFAAHDTDIAIVGGYWRQETGLASGHSTTLKPEEGVAFKLTRVDRLTVRDLTFWVSQAKGSTGGRFTVLVDDAKDFTIQNIHILQSAGDGVHVFGPASNGLIENITGCTMDDLVALGTQDGDTPALTETQGDISGVTIRTVRCDNSWSAVKLYDRLSLGMESVEYSSFRMSHIVIDDIYGSTRMQGIALEANLHADNIHVSEFDVMMPNNGNPSINVTAPYMQGLTVSHSMWRKQGGAAPFIECAHAINVTVDGLLIGDLNSPSNVLLQFDGDSTLSPNVSLRNIRSTDYLSGISMLLDKTSMDQDIIFIECANINLSSSKGCFIKSLTTSTIEQMMNVQHCSLSCTNVQFAAQYFMLTGALAVVSLTQCRLKCSDTIFGFIPKTEDNPSNSMTNQIDLGVNNCRFTGSAPLGALWDGSNVKALTATDKLNVHGTGTDVDVSILRAGNGNGPVRNTNSALSCGVGLVVGSNGVWKNLGTGATYTSPQG